MKAILIDPSNRTVSEVEHNAKDSYHDIKRLLGIESPIDGVRVDDHGGTLFLDDEGLLSPNQYGYFRWLEDAPGAQPGLFAGKGLLLGGNSEGDSVATDWTVEQVQACVTFGDINDMRRWARQYGM